MKKQTAWSIKAHFLCSPLMLVLLLAVCAIQFGLSQENATARSQGESTSRKDQPRFGPGFVQIPDEPQLPTPKAPTGVLYNQYDNISEPNTNFESNYYTDSPTHTDFTTDDFVVPGGVTWTITEIDARAAQFGPGGDTFNVAFYTNGADNLPGTQVYSTTEATYTADGNNWVITIPPAILSSGIYWVMLQGNGFLEPLNSWYWTGRSVLSNNTAAWMQPGDAYGHGCITWQRKLMCFTDVGYIPDQVFRLIGTQTPRAEPTPRPRPTPAPRP
jgi:hypothetical protein